MRGTLKCDCQPHKNCERHDLRLQKHTDIQDKDALSVSTIERLGADRVDMNDEPAAPDLLTGRWYSTEELAVRLGVDPSTVRRWRTADPLQGPPFVRLSARVVVYNAEDVEAWLRRRRTDPESAA